MSRRWAVAALVALTTACGASKNANQPAPPLALPDLSGGRFDLASLRGKVVVLDFWATWCAPCIREMPSYADFWRRNQPRGVEVVGVIFDSGEPAEIQDFVSQYRIPYRQLLGNDEVLGAYEATLGFPTTYVIDGKGVIRSKTLGSDPDKFRRLQEEVDAALASP